MKAADLLGLGFMTFAFFLGAGNIIFPPLAGFLAGEQMTPAMLGFLLTAVGLPLLTILAVARAGGGLLVIVITSYSIHYTKLYEQHGQTEVEQAEQGQAALARQLTEERLDTHLEGHQAGARCREGRPDDEVHRHRHGSAHAGRQLV